MSLRQTARYTEILYQIRERQRKALTTRLVLNMYHEAKEEYWPSTPSRLQRAQE